MRYLLTLLLISSLLPGQGACVGHSHQASDVSEPDHHAARPHVHLHGHSHHGHSHHRTTRGEPDEPAQIPADEHDQDAVYVSATEMLPVLRAAQYRPSFDPSLDCVGCLIAVLRSAGGHSVARWMWHGPPGDDANAALSYRNCVLRC